MKISFACILILLSAVKEKLLGRIFQLLYPYCETGCLFILSSFRKCKSWPLPGQSAQL